ncbi:MAG: hypothetical protein IT357_06740 [Gemmatimonadaceae bacterium]|nr:hypothetical protein [Gemmatimonadaceae bacterium]
MSEYSFDDSFMASLPLAEQAAMVAVFAYLNGGALEPAVAALNALADVPPTRGDSAESEESDDVLLGIDMSGLSPEQHERFAALMAAFEE